MSISLGQVVYSKAGRDSGRMLVVVELLDEQYVLLADGLLRKITKPKKKKRKHLKLTTEVIESVYEKLTGSQKVTDAQLRNEIKLLRNEIKLLRNEKFKA